MLDNILRICGAISIVAAALVVLYKTFRLWLPVKASITYTLSFEGKADALAVTVTNLTNAAIYVRSCKVRCTYSRLGILFRHLRTPFLSPRLYPNLRYNSAVYEFVEGEPRKLEAGQLIELEKKIYEHTINALYGPKLIAFVTLTKGGVVRSKRVNSPPVWRMIGRRGPRNG